MSEVAELEEQVSHSGSDDTPWITASQARQVLGVGHTKLAQLLKAGNQTGGKEGLYSEPSKLDRRVRLIPQKDVEALRDASHGVTVGEARRILGVSREKMETLIKSDELPVRPHPLYKRRRIVDPGKYQALLAERDALHNAHSSAHQDAASEEGGI